VNSQALTIIGQRSTATNGRRYIPAKPLMLHDPARHQSLIELRWDEQRARDAIGRIVADTQARFSADTYWPMHPRDAEGDDNAPATPLYHGACGVIWALTYLEAMSAATLARDYVAFIEPVRARNERWLATFGGNASSYLMGDVPSLLLDYAMRPRHATLDRLDALIASNVEHPARELMWGSPGTMLAALFLHERTGEARFGDLFRSTAQTLRSQLAWSDQFHCAYWTQDMYGQRSTYLDAVHGFVATALPLIQGRQLLGSAAWSDWATTIKNTIHATATHERGMVNWRAWLTQPSSRPLLMQFCHGAPGFVICLADLPGSDIDDLLLAAGEAIWAAGPLAKGSNLCHGTAGNGYAFLKLYARTADRLWLDRARAFAMHAIEQAYGEAQAVGRMRYSLWTGDPGLAIYLFDCIRAEPRFPTLDVFFAGAR